MSDITMLIVASVGLIAATIGYCIGVSTKLKDIEIAKLETEVKIFGERLAAWNKDQNNF